MKKQIRDSAVLTALLWLCGIHSLQAQDTSSSTPDSLTRYKWEIGTDLLWLIDKNSLPPTSIFVRRHTKNGAWRFRVGGSIEDYEFSNNISIDLIDRQTYTLFSRVGYEWQKSARKLNYYYGIEVHTNYSRINFNNIEFNQPINEYINNIGSEETFRVGIVGLIGFKYFLSPHISIFAEGSIFSYFQKFEYKALDYEYPIDNPATEGKGSGINKIFKTEINPLYFVGLSYHFN